MERPDEWSAKHALPLKPGEWWACHHPERPHDEEFTYYDNACKKCLWASRTAILSGTVTHDMPQLTDEGLIRERLDPHVWLDEMWPIYMEWAS